MIEDEQHKNEVNKRKVKLDGDRDSSTVVLVTESLKWPYSIILYNFYLQVPTYVMLDKVSGNSNRNFPCT